MNYRMCNVSCVDALFYCRARSLISVELSWDWLAGTRNFDQIRSQESTNRPTSIILLGGISSSSHCPVTILFYSKVFSARCLVELVLTETSEKKSFFDNFLLVSSMFGVCVEGGKTWNVPDFSLNWNFHRIFQ